MLATIRVSQHEIDRVVAETDMGDLQARHHLQQRKFLQRDRRRRPFGGDA